MIVMENRLESDHKIWQQLFWQQWLVDCHYSVAQRDKPPQLEKWFGWEKLPIRHGTIFADNKDRPDKQREHIESECALAEAAYVGASVKYIPVFSRRFE